ncbi:MAG: putative tellurium resistance membrane protein TerC [Saprospiraceae bacterium]|jgi:predicted tellurium resistance membrane protein TerC
MNIQPEHFLTLGLLVMLQAVLGFDNLLYISLESKRAPKDKQQYVRRVGIGAAIILRIALLFGVVSVIEYFQNPIKALTFHYDGILEGAFNVHALVVLLGGAFIMYTSVKEIYHMMSIHADGASNEKPKSVLSTIFTIIIMNLVFSFDSILSAIALTDVFWVMATAIIIGGLIMIAVADKVSDFLKKNRMYEVLGLFVLFVVGIMLLSEGAHIAHLHLFGAEITAMSKGTFYFVIAVLVLVDLVQSRYQKKLLSENDKMAKSN